MKKIPEILTISILISLCIISAAALEISEGPTIIYEADAGYSVSAATDGRYILIAEEKWNTLAEKQEGYVTQGSLHLYDRENETLTRIPGDIPPSMYDIAMVNGTAFWESAPYKRIEVHGGSMMESRVYCYSPGDAAPEKLPIPEFTDTDGVRILSISGSEMYPNATSVSVYNLRTGETVQLAASERMQMDSAKISGDLVAWSELRKTGGGQIYLCNLSSGERQTIGESGKEYLSLQDITGDQIFFFRSRERSLTETYEYCRMDLSTGIRTVLKEVQPKHSGAAIAYPLYVWTVPGEPEPYGQEQKIFAEYLDEQEDPCFVGTFEGILYDAERNIVVWAGWNAESNHAAISMAGFTGDTKSSNITASQTKTTGVSSVPLPTTSASSLNITVGSIAFALACVLAVLWRKK